MPDTESCPSHEALPADRLLQMLYGELHRLAEARLRDASAGQTLQPTALVHEAYLRLLDKATRRAEPLEDRAHFFFAAARAMRDIVVEHARRRSARRRAELAPRGDEAGMDPSTDAGATDMLALDRALDGLARVDQRKHDVVVLRHFAGLTHAQIGELLAVDVRTVGRDWRFARAWLGRAMSERRVGAADG